MELSLSICLGLSELIKLMMLFDKFSFRCVFSNWKFLLKEGCDFEENIISWCSGNLSGILLPIWITGRPTLNMGIIVSFCCCVLRVVASFTQIIDSFGSRL